MPTTSRSPAVNVLRQAWELIYATIQGWQEAKAPRLGAALAFYTIFSIAPLLVIAVGVASLMFGREAAEGQLASQLRDYLGDVGGKAVEAMLAGSQTKSSGLLASLIGLVTLLLGSTGLFVELQDALNTVWGVKARPGSGVWLFLRKRLLSFGFVLGMGFLLLLTLLLSVIVSALSTFVGTLPLPDVVLEIAKSAVLLQIVNQVISLGLTTLLLGMMYKLLPDARIAWRDVWVGAFGSAVLFTLGKYLIGLYLGRTSFSSTYGAAGSLVAILSWVYYSAQILLFGAEFTQSFAERYGSHVRSIEAQAQAQAQAAGAAPGGSPAASPPAGEPGA